MQYKQKTAHGTPGLAEMPTCSISATPASCTAPSDALSSRMARSAKDSIMSGTFFTILRFVDKTLGKRAALQAHAAAGCLHVRTSMHASTLVYCLTCTQVPT